MKSKVIVGIAVLAALTASLPRRSWAAHDGASLYKSKCAGCHGASGEGKPKVKAPALKGTALTTDQLAQQITKGAASSKAPHNKRSEEHTSELQSRLHLVCRLLLEKKKQQ